MRVVITGASGFVGNALAQHLAIQGHDLLLLGGTRCPKLQTGSYKALAVGQLEQTENLSELFTRADAVIHAAGLAHMRGLTEEEMVPALQRGHVEATLRVAEAVTAAQVPHFTFISSIAARELTTRYGQAKRDAENAAKEICRDKGSLLILRPPLIYGPNGPGSLARLSALILRGVPLPFSAIGEPRSLCSIVNLCDAVSMALQREYMLNGMFEICDDETTTLPEIVRQLAVGLGEPARLVPVPPILLRFAARLLPSFVPDGLFSELQLDNWPLKRALSWKPPVATSTGLQRAARSYLFAVN